MAKHTLEFNNNSDYEYVLCSRLNRWIEDVNDSLSLFQQSPGINMKYIKRAEEALEEVKYYVKLLNDLHEEMRND